LGFSGFVCGRDAYPLLVCGLRRCEVEVYLIPPVELSTLFLDAAGGEPFFVAEWDEKVAFGVTFVDVHYRRVGEVVIVVV
jgi:hypothetical protein